MGWLCYIYEKEDWMLLLISALGMGCWTIPFLIQLYNQPYTAILYAAGAIITVVVVISCLQTVPISCLTKALFIWLVGWIEGLMSSDQYVHKAEEQVKDRKDEPGYHTLLF